MTKKLFEIMEIECKVHYRDEEMGTEEVVNCDALSIETCVEKLYAAERYLQSHEKRMAR